MVNHRLLTTAWVATLVLCSSPATVAAEQRETIRDRLWIWGHPAGVYNESYLKGVTGSSTIEPVAAGRHMGIRNMIFVRYEGLPSPPFADYYEPFQKLDRVYWSLVGASGVTSEQERRQVFELAEQQENIVGFILDDFFHESATDAATESGNTTPFRASLTPDQLRVLASRQIRGTRLPLMAVVYTGQISPRAKTHLDEVDQVCLWTWNPGDLRRPRSQLDGPGKAGGSQADLPGLLHVRFRQSSSARGHPDAAADRARIRVAQAGSASTE